MLIQPSPSGLLRIPSCASNGALSDTVTNTATDNPMMRLNSVYSKSLKPLMPPPDSKVPAAP